MSVIRTVHARDYTVVDNALIKDATLSLKAKGLALTMLALPDNWQFTETWLAEQSTDGISAIKTAIAELESKGYLVRQRIKDETGMFRENDYTLYEIPMSENPMLENPMLENQLLLNTNKPNTNKPNTKSKHKYGEYGHVLLSDEEVQKLQERFPDWQDKIRELDEGIELKGYKYKSHYLAILKWAKTDKPKKQSEYDKFMGELQSMYDDEVRYGE